MSRRLDQARQKLARAEKYLAIAKGVFYTYMVVATLVLMGQLYAVQQSQLQQLEEARQSLDRSLDENARQHHDTQDYIRCIATALLTPVLLRSEALFDSCGLETSGSQSSTAPPSGPPATPAPQGSSTPVPQTPTTTSPPDPEPEPTPEQDNPLGEAVRWVVGGLTNVIQGIGKEVINGSN